MHPTSVRRRSIVGALACGVAALGACSLDPDVDHDGDDAPAEGPLANTPRIAWVFSSGGPRGIVHVGAIQAMEELGLAPDIIVGASAGAVVGVLCASGLRARELVDATMELDAWRMARYAWGGRERVSTLGIADWLSEQIRHRPLEALPMPMACVVQDLAAQRALAFTRGAAGLAAAASAAIVGQLTPVRIRGRLYADADLLVPLPVRIARALGARRVVAVDASAHEERAPPGTERWRDGDLRKRVLTQADAVHADVVLHPDSGYYASFSREHRRTMIDAGYRSAMAQAQRLREVHRRD